MTADSQEPRGSGRLPAPTSASQAPGDEFARLVELMRLLRSPDGCPWDREQSLESLAPYVLEEAHEVVDAIERGDLDELRQEIGDLVFEGVFLAQVTADAGAFTIADAVRSIAEKLVRRHPHVFAPAGPSIDSPDAVVEQWHQIKARERAEAGKPEPGPLDRLPRSLPALAAAHEIGRHVAKVGFDWPTAADVLAKVREEIDELTRAVTGEGADRAAEEMGDLLFSLANLSRKLGIEPEAALRAANRKFAARFGDMERRAAADGVPLSARTPEQLDALWNAVKEAER